MPKVPGPDRAVLLFTVIFAFAFSACAQWNDWHLASLETRAFFQRSSFLHGYMHGYEEGFHIGDLDLQMGRAYHEAKTQDKYKKAPGYRPDFGNRDTFEDGYRKGYAVGYTDSYAGRNFRATQVLQLAKSINGNDQTLSTETLDHAFSHGYDAGQKQGLHDGRSTAAIPALRGVDCNTGIPMSIPESQAYCEAYEGGYRVGYSDGFTNQRDDSRVFARK